MDEPKKEIQAFYPLEEFPEFQWLTSQFPIILKELKKNSFWMHWGSDDYDPKGHCKFLTGDWTVCPIYFGNYDPHSIKLSGIEDVNVGKLLQSMPERFPNSINLLKKIESVNFAAFSRLHPKSALATHQHVNPFSLIYHLGLIIPKENSCGLKVGNQVHIWTKPGDATIFNDTLEHSAWNNSPEERVILYVDFMHLMH